uniref:ATP-binding protein n=1 Tax=Eubacterium cellulosolvens TaxID=29322 RepID=UPI0004890F8B
MSETLGINVPVRHLTVLEEAHNILKRTSTDQPVEGGNLVGKSVEMISNAIAEMRTYGEGFIIVDQAPGLMDMSAIRNTNTKIIMRLPDQTDRELVGKAANLNEDQIKELAKLAGGVGAVYQNEWVQPILCKVDRVDISESLYEYEPMDKNDYEDTYTDRLYVAELLSKGMAIGEEVNRDEVIKRLNHMSLSDYEKISIIKMLENPPKEPDMTKLAPVMNSLFPEITKKIKDAYVNETDVTEWTREANELLIKQKVEDQVRRDIIQSTITYYLVNETNNRASLENWIQKGGLKW